MASAPVFAWQTTNTKLASALGQLRFPIRGQVTQDDRSGKVMTQFFIGDESIGTTPIYKRDFILQNWSAGALEKSEPLHPFLQGLRVEHNYDMLLDAQKQGRRIRLVGVADSFATEYRDGEELPELVQAPMVFRLADLSLAAALGTLGIPVIKIERNGDKHIYTLPVEGHLLNQYERTVKREAVPWGTAHAAEGKSAVIVGRYNGITLAQRQDGSRDLLMEIRNPGHPIVAAYHTRQVHQYLVKQIASERKIICIRPEGTQRKAFVTDNPTGSVMDKVNDHLRL
jgi:hypothetical protein